MKTLRLYPALKTIIWGGQRMIGLYSYGGENVSIVDFLIKRNEVVSSTLK